MFKLNNISCNNRVQNHYSLMDQKLSRPCNSSKQHIRPIWCLQLRTQLLMVLVSINIIQGPPYILEHFSSFLSFYHLSKGTIKQMIYQLKALIQSSLNQEWNWAWHHPEGGHAQLIEKALLLLKLVLSLSWHFSFHFHNCHQ